MTESNEMRVTQEKLERVKLAAWQGGYHLGYAEAKAASRAEIERLRAFIQEVAEYTGEGSSATPWRGIVRGLGVQARALLARQADADGGEGK